MQSAKVSRPKVVLVNRCLVKDEEERILFIKRELSCGWAGGRWEFPGGKMDKGQDVSQAMEREVAEETGLVVELESPVVFMDSRIVKEGKYRVLTYVLLVGKAKLIGGKVILSEEHTDYKWLAKNKALDLDLTEETRKALITLG